MAAVRSFACVQNDGLRFVKVLVRHQIGRALSRSRFGLPAYCLRADARTRPPPAARAALGALAIALAGCALGSGAAAPPAASVAMVADPARARELGRALLARSRALDSLRTSAVMEYRAGDRHLKAREAIVVRRPGSLRVEALSPFGVAVVVAANDSELAIFRSSDNTLMRGAATARTLDRFAQIPLAPRPAVNLLLGLPPDDRALQGSLDSVRAQDGLLVASYKAADGSTTELGYAGSELTLVRQRDLHRQTRYQVRYSDYRDIGGLLFAHRLEADFPLAGAHVDFKYFRPIINGAADQSLFVLEPGPATREFDLDQAARLPAMGGRAG